MFGLFQDHGTLFQRRMCGRWDFPVLPGGLHRWCERQGQRDDSSITGAGFDELRRLRDILSWNLTRDSELMKQDGLLYRHRREGSDGREESRRT